MRPTVLFALALLLSSVPVPSAAAEPLLADAAGDVRVVAGPDAGVSPGNAPPSDLSDSADLLSLDVEESESSLTLTLKVARITDNSLFSRYRVHFEWEGAAYFVEVTRFKSPGGIGDSDADLHGGTEDDFGQIAELDHSIDAATGTIVVTLPKVLIVGEEGHVPVRGKSLTNLRVTAEVNLGSFRLLTRVNARLEDAMPDTGGVEYAFTRGGFANGHLEFEAPDPVRVSNGEGTTFVFEVHLHNNGEKEDEVALAVSDVPNGWTAKVQSPLKVPPGEEKPVYVLATLPFEHKHGGYQAFNVTATSGLDSTVRAVTALGVLHTPVAMPAGHHPDLFLHATAEDDGVFSQLFPFFTNTYMNTDPDHEGDLVEVPPNEFGDGFGWSIPLGPALAMGLDFDTKLTGTLAGSVVGRYQGDVDVRAELWYVEGYEEIALLAESEPATATLDLQNASPFSVTMVPTDDADYVPYAPGRNLRLYLEFSSPDDGVPTVCCFPGTSPALVTADFKLTLPLLEYHDRLPAEAEVTNAVKLVASGPLERDARPGNTAAFAFNLTNAGSESDVFLLDLAGAEYYTATVAPEGPVRLAAGETQRLVLGVFVPFDAGDGELFEVLLLARSAADPSNIAIARTLTTAMFAANATDETDVLRSAQREGRDTPAAGAVAVLAVAVAVGLLRRRR